jgi:hypothetical protein
MKEQADGSTQGLLEIAVSRIEKTEAGHLSVLGTMDEAVGEVQG